MSLLVEEIIKREEGFRAKPYKDHLGNITIGYGFTCLTEKEASVVLKMKLDRIREVLNNQLSGLSQNRQDVIISMAFQLGISGCLSFNKMWQAIYSGDWSEAAHQMLLSRWAKQTPERVRRMAQIMREG